MAKRVLICGFTSNVGGMETYIMNIYRNMDREKLQFDFLYPYDEPMAFHDEVLKLGGHIYHIPGRKKNIFKHYRRLNKLFKEKKFEGVYYQCNKKLLTMEVFNWAKKYGVEKRVIHSHNTQSYYCGKLHAFREKLTASKYDKYVNGFFACSDEAGKWMFGDREYRVINNGINTDVFKYNEESRKRIRTEEGIPEDAFVLGTIGRLSEEKNPEYLVELFKMISKNKRNCYFVHLGSGEKSEEISKMVSDYGLHNFLLKGRKDNPADYLNAMDVFLLPSIYEGFPIVMVEAQSTGLPCIASTNITTSANITGLVKYLSLDNIQEWYDYIMSIADSATYQRTDRSDEIESAGYGVRELSQSIEDYFCN